VTRENGPIVDTEFICRIDSQKSPATSDCTAPLFRAAHGLTETAA